MLTWYFWDFWRNKPTSGSRIKARDLPGFNSTSWAGISRAFPEFLVSLVFSWDILILCFPRISYSLPGFRMLSQDFPRLPGISHVLQGFFRFLLDFVFWRQYFFFCFIAQGKLRGEKNIMHSLRLNFSRSFGQPLFWQPLALELWCYP